jgi:dTMP kinase
VSGRFITFEGGEGVGKTTQLKRAVSWLQAAGREVVVTREPGGKPRAEQLRRI